MSPAEEERAFLEAYDPTAFDRPSVSVDVVILTALDEALHALLVRRAVLPQKDRWALPGGFVRMDESLDQAATRVLADKGGLANVYLEQLYTFGAVDRDPRMRVLSVAYVALVAAGRVPPPSAGRVLARIEVPWEGEAGGPVDALGPDGAPLPLAFDHADMLAMAVKRLRGKLNYTPIGYQLLPPTFTLRALQTVHETILGRALNKDSFRRRMLASGELEATGEREQQVEHRPAELYRFVHQSAL